MKVIFANNYFYLRGGSERVLFDELEILKANGHEVVPFSRQFEKNIYSEYSRFFAPPIEYENVSISKKIPTSFKLIYSRECKDKIIELLEFYKPDLIHGHNIYGRLTTSIIDGARRRGIPVVITLHDYKLICPSYLMLFDGEVCERCQGKRFFCCVLKRCHKGSYFPSLIYTMESYFNSLMKKYEPIRYFISPSKFLLRKHAEAGFAEEKLVHLPNFIEIESFESSYTLGDYILFAGRLVKEKGVLTLLQAIKEIDVLIRIVGDGPMRAEYETYTKENKITNVFFDGYKSGEELKALFRNAAFLVFPSEWYENAPVAILEAFAYGKPVIGSDIGGIPEMVIDEDTGLLFTVGNYRELREKIEYLLSRPSVIAEMGKRGRKKVEVEHNPEIHYQRLMKVYERACS